MDTSDGAMNNNALQPMRNFMSTLASQLSSNSYVGLVAYGSNAEKRLSWTSPQDASRTLSNIDLRRLSATDTNKGLDLARTDFFSGSNDKSNPNLVILVSEGPRANSKLQSYRTACQMLKNQNVRVMVVGNNFNVLTIIFIRSDCKYIHGAI